MFTVLRKNFGGRVHDRYFSDYENAKKALFEDVERTIKGEDCKMLNRIDQMNISKGFYNFEVCYWFYSCNEACLWSLIESCFED